MPTFRMRLPFLRALACMAAGLAAAGCQQSLFPESAPRTQFEQFDTMRSGAAPMEEPDVFGAKQPALRARLAPKTAAGPSGSQ